MATAARQPWHQNGQSVDGSLAYDLDWAVRERELRHAGELPRRQEREQVKVHERPKVQVRERQHVSPFTVLATAASIVMAVMVLFGYIQLTVLSADTVALKKELSTLETENLRLTTEYERMFDLATVKEAAEAAGMVKPGSSQICYIDLSEGDSAVVCRETQPSVLARIVTSLRRGAAAVVEYLD